MDIQTLLPLLQKFLPILNDVQTQEPTFTQNQISATQNQNSYNQNISETASLYPNSYIDSPAVTPTQSQPSSQNTSSLISSNPIPNQGAQTSNMLSQITSLLSSGGGSNNGLINLLSKSNGGDMLNILSSMIGGKKNNSQICELKCVNDYTFD